MIRVAVAILIVAFSADVALAQLLAGAPANSVTAVLPAQAASVPAAHVALGDVAASIIEWTMVAFGPVLGTFATWIAVRILKAYGIKNTDLLKDQLQRIIVNGINAGAAEAEKNLRGRGGTDIKSATANYAVAYAQTHGADIIKALGLDPNDGEAVQAIRARIETALADPATPIAPTVSAALPVAVAQVKATVQ